MRLQDQINLFNKKALANLPAETLAIMAKATRDLAASGIVARALAKGDAMPPFSLPNVRGGIVSSTELLSKGPLVVSFFRGSW